MEEAGFKCELSPMMGQQPALADVCVACKHQATFGNIIHGLWSEDVKSVPFMECYFN